MFSDLTFGYYDTEKYTGDINWIDIKFKYMFGIKLEDVSIGGRSLNLCSGGKECLITFDSGTTYIAFPIYATNKMTKMGLPSKVKS